MPCSGVGNTVFAALHWKRPIYRQGRTPRTQTDSGSEGLSGSKRSSLSASHEWMWGMHCWRHTNTCIVHYDNKACFVHLETDAYFDMAEDEIFDLLLITPEDVKLPSVAEFIKPQNPNSLSAHRQLPPPSRKLNLKDNAKSVAFEVILKEYHSLWAQACGKYFK